MTLSVFAHHRPSIVYHAGTGEVSVDPPAGTALTSINIDSAAGIFTGQAAQNLGCSPARTIRAVIIPSAKTGLIVAALFCFILSFGDFVSPYYLGGSRPPTLSILIVDTTKSGQQWPRAAVVAITMIVTLFVIAFTAVTLAYRKPRSK